MQGMLDNNLEIRIAGERAPLVARNKPLYLPFIF